MLAALAKNRCQVSLARLNQALRIAAAPLAILLAGCVTLKIDELRQAETDIAASEAVVVLSRRDGIGLQAGETFIDCVSDTLATGNAPLRVVPERIFVDRLFPWFEPGTAPSKIEAMAQLLRRRNVAEKITDSGVRYLVWIDGTTQSVGGGGGGLACAIGPGGGGCIGLLSWENRSSYEASIWDMKHAQSAGLISAEASGSSYLPAFIIPIPLIARTQAAACNGLARQLQEFLTED
ncbi:MAG TPA: hypothetical protein VHJ19_02750 [Gammaproteobacteria bacterium]|nr:hypothetical protein [Gammaproteobacteria bacterium]